MIKIVCVGKVKDKNLAALISEYAEKINHYHKLEIVEVKDEAIKDNEQAVLDKEAESVLSKIRDDEYVILLDLHGKSIDSIGLANKLDRLFLSHNHKVLNHQYLRWLVQSYPLCRWQV